MNLYTRTCVCDHKNNNLIFERSCHIVRKASYRSEPLEVLLTFFSQPTNVHFIMVAWVMSFCCDTLRDEGRGLNPTSSSQPLLQINAKGKERCCKQTCGLYPLKCFLIVCWYILWSVHQLKQQVYYSFDTSTTNFNRIMPWRFRYIILVTNEYLCNTKIYPPWEDCFMSILWRPACYRWIQMVLPVESIKWC